MSLTEIQKLLAGMEEQIIANLSAQISSNHATNITKHDQTIQAIETAMNDFDERMATMESTLSCLAKENEQLKLKVDDLENKFRRCNIRITGIPEEEGKQPTSFIESFLQKVFGAQAFPRTVAVNRAHRLAVQKRKVGAPRPFIACIHHFQMKQRIMQLARERGSLDYKGSEIHIYADYSAEVARRRATFAPIKAQLKKDGLRFSLLFPAKLRVTVNGNKHEFNTPSEVAAFLENGRLQQKDLNEILSC